jgi:hypothetical protein
MNLVPRSDLATISAVADERINESLAFGWNLDLHCTAVACCGRCPVLLPMRTFRREENLFRHGSWFEMTLK